MEPADAAPVRIAVCVCTYRRNEALRRLLERVAAIAERTPELFELAVVVVDDNPSPVAEPVVTAYADRSAFALGIHYRHSGEQNISIARNLAVETGRPLGSFIAMTDDDCVPDLDWIEQLLAMQRATGADAVSGRFLREAADGSPRWIVEQRALDPGYEDAPDGAVISIGSTPNCLLSTAWLAEHPTHRFDVDYGRIGGEDMIFFRGATKLGMRSVFATAAVVRQPEPVEELTLWWLVRDRYWLGNSEAVTNRLGEGVGRTRLVLRGSRRAVSAAGEVPRRAVRRQPPHVRASLVRFAGAVGMIVGALGVKVRHR